MPSSFPQAILFDLDGTLIDSLPDLAAAVNRMLAVWRRPALTAPAVMAMVGDGADALVERCFAAGGGLPAPLPDLLDAFLDDYQARSTELTRPWPEVVDTLSVLRRRRIALAVCTNKPSDATARVLTGLGLDGYFDLVVGADDTPAIKPDPAHVRVILDRLGVAAGQAALVGDSGNDIAAARAAGVRSVAVSYGYAHGPIDGLGADLVIDSFGDLPAALGIEAPPPSLAALEDAFLAEIGRDLAVLRILASGGEGETLGEHLHAMRGKSAMFGAVRLDGLLAQIELDPDDPSARCDAIARYLTGLGAGQT